nr:TolC family protein [Bordetella sp. N]
MSEKQRSFRYAGGALLLATFLSGCVALPTPTLPADVPDTWAQQPGAQGPSVDLRSWWTAFNDSTLNALVDEALQRNLDIAQAEKLLEAERQLSGRQGSSYLPVVSAGGRPVQDASGRHSFFHASIDASWELDLFGGGESEERLGAAEVGGAEAKQQGIRVAVVAGVVRNYLDMTVANWQLANLQKISALDQRAAHLAKVRSDTRLANADEITNASLRLQQGQAEIAAMRQTAAQHARALALLLGRAAPDAAWATAATPPDLAAFRLQQVPADLLRSRPDVREAEAEVLAAAARVGIARAALYPRLSLAGTILYSHNITTNRSANNNYLPSIGPVISIPLFDWGRLRAEVKAGEKRMDASLLGYRKAVMSGASEVEGALSTYQIEQDRVAALTNANQVLSRKRDMQRRRSELGISSAFESIDDEQRSLETSSDLTLARASRSLAFIALYKALGGAPLTPVTEEKP